MKKGRHRRFEEARKLKQAGPSAADLGFHDAEAADRSADDEYAEIAERYGWVDDDESDDGSDDE